MAAQIDVSSHIAYPYIPVDVADSQARIARHVDPVLDRDAELAFPHQRRKAVASSLNNRRNRQLFVGTPLGSHADFRKGLFRALLLAGVIETISRLDDGDLDLWFIPTFHCQVTIRIVETNGTA